MDLPQYAYFKGAIVPYAEAKVGVLTHALNYGTGVFGGVRAYKNDENGKLYLFRPYDHYRRFLNSCKMMLMEFDETPESLTQLTIDLLKKSGFSEDVYIRPLAYKSSEMIGVKLHDVEADFSIVALPFGKYVANDTNAHVTISSWRRLDDNVIPARGKISGAYANSAFIKTDAMRSGFDEALVLTQAGHLSEGSAENVFIVRDGVMITPSVTENILEGITRRSVMELAAAELGMEVVERPIDRTEVYICDELFMTGTAAQVTAITKVDHRPVGNGEMGPVAAKLRDLFFDIVRAKNPKYSAWNIEV
ncbi:MAG: branched-chain amino acid transaminase [Anaerolineales bacterium]|uniref:Branched-chain-amino-acid aminotransferase n=1 Tax=Candidatus Desulfolinea nitratireducens TaxID=2841698 RepID=A0A8J6NJ69_9CHLR|nr:branched-chain amino acid transaminase [Candidatus Desulfolinea nitratireducens]